MSARSRFPNLILGAVGASLVWIIAVVLTSTTPEEARARRSEPDLPPPTALVQMRTLEQVSWYPCHRSTQTTAVRAIAAPPGTRSVVTALAKPRSTADTGKVLARVAGVPLVAVSTPGVFYRDLKVGSTGSDVEALTTAMRRAGWIPRSTSTLGVADIASWRANTGLASDGTISWRNLVAVPAGATVGTAEVAVGDEVRENSALLTVSAKAEDFICDVTDPAPSMSPRSIRFEAEGAETPVSRIVVHVRDEDSPGSVAVLPTANVHSDSGRLGVDAGGTDKPVVAVPLSAVKTSTAGGTVVVVADKSTTRRVTVHLGASAQGWIELVGSDLSPGSKVLLFGSQASGSPAQ